ncbi:hypothetical protein POTOM_040157 [Populus tomentosa]|uniref:Uncharacterized protein n=1 Tax=Populus tomentosa TaxID=118781 RepID=A0A8X7YVY9_POPTO|nr:hypothetical protein POTOM_040157 [Populus tomentosa]
MAVEIVGGIKANSLAILTDAAHLLSDVAAFAISLFSIWASGWEATPRRTYGYFRIEILGEVQGALMFAVSAAGLLVNIVMALLLGHGHDLAEPLLSGHTEVENKTEGGHKQKRQRNINIQGAYLHVLGDTIQSFGVMLGGAIIWEYSGGSHGEHAEGDRRNHAREGSLRNGRGGCRPHELHIWAITVGKFLLACHVMIKPDADADMVLDKVIDYIRTEHNISHVTIQIKRQ